MTVPVHTTIPDSTLTPEAARRKISASGVRGLGEFCIEWADDGVRGLGEFCIEWADDGSCSYALDDDWGTTTSIPNTGGYYGTFDPSIFASSTPATGGAAEVTLLGTRVDSGGDLVAILSNGTEYSVQYNGSVVRGSSGGTATGNTTVSRQQSTAWGQLLQSLTSLGVRLGTVALLPPGSSLTPNGTIVGSGQSLVRPGVITSNSLTSGINAMLQNPMFLIAGFGLIAVIALSGGRR
jgi:hypothetical protein